MLAVNCDRNMKLGEYRQFDTLKKIKCRPTLKMPLVLFLDWGSDPQASKTVF